MAKMKVKTGDNVLVIAGKDKGKISVVTSTSPKEGKVRVQDVFVQTKHVKARRANEKSEIRKIEGAIEASNIMVVCPECNKATRIAYKVIDGKNTRVCKKCGASLDSAKKFVKQTKAVKASASASKKSSVCNGCLSIPLLVCCQHETVCCRRENCRVFRQKRPENRRFDVLTFFLPVL